MKRIISSSVLLAILALAFTGCLKDKGFDNRSYGINDPDSQPPGVGFPLASNAKNTFGLNAGTATLQTIDDIVFINILGGTPPKSDVQVTLTLNDGLRTAYNTANGTNILAMPPALYNLPSLTVTIPAGSLNGKIPINVPSTVTMDPNNTYGLGFTISAVTGGYNIASNLKDLLVEITVKNRYDGIYSYVSGFVQRYTSPGAFVCCDGLTGILGPANSDIVMSTSGANSVSIADGAWRWAANNGVAGIDGFSITVDPATFSTTQASSANGTLANFGGFSAAFVPVGFSGPPTFPLAGTPAVNKYDPATKTFHLAWRWNPSANVREYEVFLKFKRAR